MSILSLAQADQQVAAGPQPGEASRLPVSFGEGFEAAWQENQLFGQSVAHSNARMRVLDDYVNELRQKTGKDIGPDVQAAVAGIEGENTIKGDPAGWAVAREAGAKAGIPAPTEDEIDERAIAVSRAARQTYGDVAAREKAGGGAGLFLGGLGGAVADPINLATIPLGGGEGGILLTALRFGAIAGATQAGNEALQSGFREQVQPGYAASGEPLANVLTAGAEGAVLGGGTKALGNLWTRMKTGAWPTSVRDAGNILESEANIQQSNVYPGVKGEVAHRAALSDAINDVSRGTPVDVASHITPDIEASADERFAPLMAARGEAQRAMAAAEAARPGGPAPELPFEQTAAEAQAGRSIDTLSTEVAALAKRAGYDMPAEEAAQIAARMVKAPDDQVGRLLDQVTTNPSLAAEAPPRGGGAPIEQPATALPPSEVTRVLGSPDHEAAVRADIDRARMTKDVKIPAGVDEKGEPVFRSLDSAMDEVDGYKAAAEQIQACAAPAKETTE